MSTYTFKSQYKKEIETLFLRESLFERTEDLSDSIQEGILCLVDHLSDYHEEGKALFPEVAIVSDMNHLKTNLPHLNILKIGSFSFSNGGPSEFEKILKSCAPLAVDGWMIYIEINQYASPSRIEYGVFHGEKNILSESLLKQISDKAAKSNTFKTNVKCIFVSNIGQKTVLLQGQKAYIRLAFSANSTDSAPYEAVKQLSEWIVKDVKGKAKSKVMNYLLKGIYDAINQGHGTLIAVANDNISFDENNFRGQLFDFPLDFAGIIKRAVETESPDSYHEILKMGQIAKSVINTDGITIFSRKGELLGYHFMIHKDSYEKSASGARSQAFEAMVESNKFCFCLYKSQDGKTKIWQKVRKNEK